MTKERQEQIKQLLLSKKEDIKKSIKRATYGEWDKHSPIWAYSYVFDDEKEITDIKRIEWLLKQPQPGYIKYFLNKEDMDTYKWLYKVIETEIDNMATELFKGNVTNFVDVKDICYGDKNVYYVKEN